LIGHRQIIPKVERDRFAILDLSTHGDPDAAVIAIKGGVWGYIEKSPYAKDIHRAEPQ
jgi:hypothetical protein